MLYTIKPLEWVASTNWEGKPKHFAQTSQGYYQITEGVEYLGSDAVFWECEFCDYSDEASGYMIGKTLDQAKQYCERLWRERLELDLIKVTTPAPTTA